MRFSNSLTTALIKELGRRDLHFFEILYMNHIFIILPGYEGEYENEEAAGTDMKRKEVEKEHDKITQRKGR
uniref:Uncharacterized protein n=1 Tax=Utricularia reniformis TaxID=192314 RepID=A0A1Y0B2V3_9LAMI|nr:hypothetical protein AEK19_MT1529 [Utricularia reniformis]ART31718.1 hypothetical protein AEK19_MT1529 [Utricularia reniformis]